MALVSSYDRLKELTATAAESEDAAQLQFLKTLDSVDAKVQQFKTSLQSLYVSSGLENTYKSLLDIGNRIVTTFTNIPTIMNLPIAAVAKFGLAFASLANVVTTVFGLIKFKISEQNKLLVAEEQASAQKTVIITKTAEGQVIDARMAAANEEIQIERDKQQQLLNLEQNGAEQRAGIVRGESNARKGGISRGTALAGLGLNIAGLAASTIASQMDERSQGSRNTKAWFTGAGSTLQGAGMGAAFGLKGMAIGAVLGSIAGAFEAFGIAIEDTEEKVKNLKTALEETGNAKLTSKNELKTLKDYKDQFDKLYAARNDNNEAYQEYINLSNEIAENYPTLISGMDAEGNYVVELADNYEALYNAKKQAYNNDFIKDGIEQIKAYSDNDYLLSILGYEPPAKDTSQSWNPFEHGIFNKDEGLGAFSAYFEDLKPNDWTRNFEELLPEAWKTLDKKDRSGDGQIWDNRYYPQGIIGLTGNLLDGYIGDKASRDKFLTEYNLSDAESPGDFIRKVLMKVGEAIDAGKQLDEINKEFSNYFEGFKFNADLYDAFKELAANSKVRDEYLSGVIKSLNIAATRDIISQNNLELDAIETDATVNEIQKAWDDFKDSHADMDLADAWQAFAQSMENQITSFVDTLNLYAGLNDNQTDQIKNIYTNIGQYSGTDIMALLKDFSIDTDSQLGQLILSHYIEVSEKAKQRFKDGMKEASLPTTLNNGKTFSSVFGADYLDTILQSYKQILNNTSLDPDRQKAQIDGLTSIYTAISDAGITPEQKAAALSAIQKGDLTSLTGIYSLIDTFHELGVNIDDQLLEYSRIINVNMTTEFSSLASSISKNMEDFDKAVSSASKGMDAKNATEMAQKLGTTLSEGFTLKDGKYFLNDITALKDAYLKYNESLFNRLNEDANNMIHYLEKNEYDKNVTPEQRQQYEQIFDQYKKEWASLTPKQQASYTGGIKDYTISQLKLAMSDANSIAHQYSDYQINSLLITNGQIEAFIKNVMKENASDSDISKWMGEMAKGNFDSLPKELQAYASELWKYYSGTQKAVFESAIKSLESGEKTMVKVTEQNKEFLQKYGKPVKEGVDINNLAEGDEVWLDIDKSQIPQLQQDIAQAVVDKTISKESANSLLAQLQDIRFKGNRREVFENVLKSYDNFSYELMQSITDQTGRTIKQLTDLGYFKRDPLTGAFSATVDGLNFLYDRLQQTRNVSQKDLNKYKAQIDEIANEDNTNVILEDIIKNRQSLSTANVASLATMLGTDYDTVLSMLQDNGNGTYRLGLGTIQSIIDGGQGKVSDAVINMLAEEIDNIVASVTGLVSGQTKGYTSMADMQKVVSNLKNNGFKQANGEELNIQSLFEWNDEVHAFVLNSAGMLAQIANARKELAKYEEGSDEYFIYSKILSDMPRQLTEQVDIMGFVGAENKDKAAKILANNLKAYNDYLSAFSDIPDLQLIDIDNFINNLKSGGADAVAVAQKWAKISGVELSASDISDIYLAQVKPITEAIDQLLYQEGSIVGSVAGKILEEQGVAQQIGTTGQYLVTGVADLYEAYKSIYEELAATGEATLSELNNVHAAAFEAKDGQQRTIDILNNAAHMTYTQMAEILTQAGYEFTDSLLDVMVDSGMVEQLGGANIRIADFDKFAKVLNLQTGSEEYWTALKTYNDAMIELDHQMANSIKEEVSAIADAKPGDRLNLTNLTQALTDAGNGALEGLSIALKNAGLSSEVANGILTVSKDDSILTVIQTISQYAATYGGLLSSDVAELADTIDDVLKSFTSAIASGIEGSLSNADAQSLQVTAKNLLGIDLDFTKTATGLKISSDAAISLYTALQKVDTIAAVLVFDSLSESLQKAGEDCENISTTMANVAKMEKELGDNPNNSKLQQRLDLYRQIANTQIQDPESYDFMGRKLPDYLQGPKNYWDSVGKAYEAMNEAFEGTKVTGVKGKMHLMEIDDFYNIVNEMSNLANITGTKLVFAGQTISGDAEETANLINKGLGALTNIDGKGVKVNLGKLGFDFSTSADDMTKDFDTAVKEMANAQIEMLDSMIQLLEAVVAMEELGKIDIDGNGLEFDEMFDILGANSYQATENAQAAANQIIQQSKSNEDLEKALKNIEFNEVTLGEMLEGLANGGELNKKQAAETFTTLKALYQMFLSGNYDLDNLIDSIAQVAAESGIKGEIKIDGKRKVAVGYGVVLESNGDGEYIVDDKPYKTADQALQALALSQDKDIDETVELEDGTPIGIIQDQRVDYKIRVQAGEDGKLHYFLPDGTEAGSKKEAITKLYEEYKRQELELDPSATIYSIEEFTAQYQLESKVEIVNQEQFANATHDQIQALAQALLSGKQEDIRIAAGAIGVEVEFDVNGKMKEGQYQQLAEMAHLEDKTVSMHLGADFTGAGGDQLTKLLEENGISITVEINPSDAADNLAKLAEEAEKLNDEKISAIADAAEKLADNLGNAKTNFEAFNTFISNNTASTATTFSTISENLKSIQEKITAIKGESFDNFSTLSTQLKTVADQVEQIWTVVQKISNTPLNLTVNKQGDETTEESTITQTISSSVTLTTEDAQKACTALSNAAKAVAGPLTTAANKCDNLTKAAGKIPEVAYRVNALARAMDSLPQVSSRVTSLATAMSLIPNVADRINSVTNALNRIPSSKNIAITATVAVKATGGTVTSQTPPPKNRVSLVDATGNVALAKGRGPRHKTLMGELGPELVVSGGEYFVVGENGAEMFDLPDDAIVFNHLQTKKLLANGTANGRGRAVKNERTSVALASGNTSGPAMASARAALAALKQIRAMWQSMASASSKDLGSQAGRNSGGGGGGGGGGDKDNKQDDKVEGWQATNSTAEIQRWYNLLRQIAKIEEEITHQNNLQDELLSSRIANGKAIYQSQKRELALLTDEITKNRELSYLQKSWYDNKRRELENSGYGMIFTYNEQGLQQYVDGPNRGLDVLEKLTARDINGQATGHARTSKTQLDYLQSIGFDTNSLVYNDDGTRVFEWINGVMSKADTGEAMTDQEKDEAYTQMMDNFWDNLDGWRDELDGIYDSYNEQLNTVLENESKRNEILKEIADNQLAVEEAVLNAITEREQAVIDNLQGQRDALEDASQKYIDGLQDSLNKEKQQYQDQQEVENLNKLRRQLLILQRSGGSGSQIRNLQEQIRSKEQDAYFAAQQEQINAIKEASDAEIERLDAQIDLLTETLEYQKEHGLLWEEVQQIMSGDIESIATFIHENTAEWDGKSALAQFEEDLELKKQLGQWTEYRDDTETYWTSYLGQGGTVEQAVQGLDESQWQTYDDSMHNIFGNTWDGYRLKAEEAFNKILEETGDSTLANVNTTDSLGLNLGDAIHNKNSISHSGVSSLAPTLSALPSSQQAAALNNYSGGQNTFASYARDSLPERNISAIASRLITNRGTEWKSDSTKHWKENTHADGSIEKVNVGTHNKDKKVDTGSTWTCYCSVCNHYMGVSYKTPAEQGPAMHRDNTFDTISSAAPTPKTTTNTEIKSTNNNNAPKASVEKTTNAIKTVANKIAANATAIVDNFKKLMSFKEGGEVNFTGLAMVHGTSQHPEYVLNAEQYKILKDGMLSGANTLSGTINSINNSIHNTANAKDLNNVNNGTESIVIEKAEVNMNVAQLANDYDARRAGAAALDEMVRIARKSGTRTLSRR